MATYVTVSKRGVVTLPAKLRREAGIQPDEQLIAEVTSDGLLLRPTVTLPVEIYTRQRIQEFDSGEAELATAIGLKPKTSKKSASQ